MPPNDPVISAILPCSVICPLPYPWPHHRPAVGRGATACRTAQRLGGLRGSAHNWSGERAGGGAVDYTTLGRTGLKVSVAGLGCGGNSRLGLSTGKTEADAVALIRAAIDLGVNLI